MPSGKEGDDEAGIGIPAIETATLLIAVLSSLVLGSATAPMLRYLDLEGKSDSEIYRRGWEESLEGENSAAAGDFPEPTYFDPGTSEFHRRFKEFDNTYLKPIFGGRTEGIVEEEYNSDTGEHLLERNSSLESAHQRNTSNNNHAISLRERGDTVPNNT
jgi:hypothetical protein